ncbi:phenylcoumaran benzylic ether reductase Betv6-like isoform X1 [Trifolium pratense]|uniref:phenylcoumaran benzylic ether reductase Betv6-like isoform X1 n=1 Tax=Trifolium pratense TaxID=57577 RepID=UPI001E694F8F|nr:phenylcoumaran benzylic ether reductase Betv6-like isoform X1 [Trifolium pratense]
MAEKSRILIIGGTGYIGKHIVEASVKAGHETFALVRDSTMSDPIKAKLLHNFRTMGVNLVLGDLYDYKSLVKVIKLVDVVISAVSHTQAADQRFFPSEFGNDVDRVHAIEPAKSVFAVKAQIRRTIEAEGIPYTYVSTNSFAGYFVPSFVQPGATGPPREKVIILGDGNKKGNTISITLYIYAWCDLLSLICSAVFNKEEDIGTYTIRAVDDPRTLNKILYIRPPNNIYTFNEVVALWEMKIGKTLQKIYVLEDELLKDIEETPFPENLGLAICHSVFVKGDHTNFEIEPSFGVEASTLYPDVNYTTLDESLDHFL